MDAYRGENTAEPVTVYVKFGPKGHQEISAELASLMLTDLHEAQPELFGKYLARAMTGVNPRGGKR